MFMFVCEPEFHSALAGLRKCPICAHRLLRRMEAPPAGCTITVSEIRVDFLLEGMQLVPSIEGRSLSTGSSIKARTAERTHA